MKHGHKKRKLNRTAEHRKAMFRNMATSLLHHEQIKTTLPKAKELRSITDKLITRAKKGNLHQRRKASGYVKHPDVVKKLFSELAARYQDRPGGYTRVLKAGFRYGDGAPMAIIELVERDPEAKKKSLPPVSTKSEGGRGSTGGER